MCWQVQYNGTFQSGKLYSSLLGNCLGLFGIYFFFSDCSVLSFLFLLFGCCASCVCHSFINIFSPLSFSLIFFPSIFWEILSTSYFRPSIDFSFLFTFFLTSKGFICSLKFSFLFLLFLSAPCSCLAYAICLHDRFLLSVSSCSRVPLSLNFFLAF